MNDLRASVPKVNELLLPDLVEAYGHKRVTRWARQVLADARERAQALMGRRHRHGCTKFMDRN